MAFRLSDYVTGGIVINRGRYSTHGRLGLRGFEGVLHFELTGYPAADLLNKTIEFEVAENDREASPEDVRALEGLKCQQIGATGEMTAIKPVRAGFPIPGQPPAPMEPCLFLEWFGPNGRVVIELPASKVRFLDEAEIARRDQLMREAFEEQCRAAELARSESTEPDFAPELGNDEADLDEPDFGLVSDEFEREMERKSAQIDREAMPPDPAEAKAMREFELLDEMLESGEETPIAGFLDGLEIPATSSISSDAEAEQYLKPLIARLALFSTALDVCDHCTPLKAYKILVDEILPSLGVYEPLIGGDFVHHVCAYEHCDECRAEEERGEVPF